MLTCSCIVTLEQLHPSLVCAMSASLLTLVFPGLLADPYLPISSGLALLTITAFLLRLFPCLTKDFLLLLAHLSMLPLHVCSCVACSMVSAAYLGPRCQQPLEGRASLCIFSSSKAHSITRCLLPMTCYPLPVTVACCWDIAAVYIAQSILSDGL